jgi:uncharacterized Zn-binding protein involved in type VI secretion
MSGVSRKGDKNQTGGAIVTNASTVLANGILVGLLGSKISAHAPFDDSSHASATVNEASPTVFAEGIPVARIGSSNSCGHSMVEGSANVFVP